MTRGTSSSGPDGGWTRADGVALLARLTDGFVHAIPNGGSPAAARLPGAPPDAHVPSIEGFARMSVAWAAWLGEPSNPDSVVWDGRRTDIGALLARGLADATDPGHSAWWGPIGDRDQRIVEAAEIATAVWLGGERLRAAIDALDPDAFGRVLDWLGLVDGRDVWPDNWVLFPMLSRVVRKLHGRVVDVAAIDAAIDWMLAHDVGDGWTSDGEGHALDLYSGWAIHWHLLWWAAIDGARRPAVRRRIIRRSSAWLRFMAAAVAPDGAIPRFGRSLGYRFAAAAPFAQAAVLGIDPLPPGVGRRLVGTMIRHSLAEGAIDDETNWLRIGVGGERPAVVEGYVSAGAVAWAAHALVSLRLPAADPFWAAAEEPASPPVRTSGSVAAPRAGLLVAWRGGATTLHNARTGHPADIPGHDYAATYGKLAYRSGHAFDVPVARGATAGSDDALVAIEDDLRAEHGVRVAHRNESLRGHAGPAWIDSTYQLPTSAPTRVRTVVLVLDGVEVRVSSVHTAGRVRLRDGGPVVSSGVVVELPDRGAEADAATIAVVRNAAGVVAIRALAGFDRAGTAETGPGRLNLVDDCGLHPSVEERAAATGARLVAAAIVVGADAAAAVRTLRAVRVVQGGQGGVQVTGGDPRSEAIVHLGHAAPDLVEIAGRRFRGPRVGVAIARVDDTSLAGERLDAIDGVIRLARPSVVEVRRAGDAVEVTTASGFAVDQGWSPAGRWVRFGHAVSGFDTARRLDDPGIVPDALVRRAVRVAGTGLVTARLER